MLLFLVIYFIHTPIVFGCSGGQFPTAGGCYNCPRGYQCDGTNQPVKCLAGTYSDFGSNSCTDCSAGFKCEAPSQIPVPCAFGEYSPSGSTVCLACPKGYYCPDPSQKLTCTSGYYCLGGTNNQIQCPRGYFCPTPYDSPTRCSDGTYSAAGESSCHDCTAGSFCADPSFDMETCPPGHYSLAKWTTCLPIPADHSGTSSTNPTPCSPGYYAPQFTSSCVSCPAGYYCDHSVPGIPQRCADGYYSDGGDQYCKPCPPGSECPDKQKVDCASGFYSTGGTNICKRCPAGSACSDSTREPMECLPGQYAGPGSSSCSSCTAGHYCPSKGLSAQYNCPIGTYQPYTKQTYCITCEGTSSCTSEAVSSISLCTEGQYFDGYQTCRTCPAGYFCPYRHTSEVLPCPAGFYSNAGSVMCSICEPGKYCADGTAQTSCADGTYSDYGSMRCEPCPPGYECKTNLKTIYGRMKCPPGFYILNNVCTICPLGHMCPEPQFAPVPCTQGTYANVLGLIQCAPCPTGYRCTDRAVTICADGEYSELFDHECHSCPANHMCTYFSKMDCPLNYYSAAGSQECTPCPNGKECLRASPGSTCPSGQYSSPTTYICTQCPVGHSCGGSSATKCIEGYYSPHEGRSSCLPCPSGTYSYEGSSKCHVCPPAHYCEAQKPPKRCPIGQYSYSGDGACQPGVPGFVYNKYASEQFPLLYMIPKGQYSSLNADDQIELYSCPRGTYGPMLGSIDDTTCYDCPQGYYCPEGTGDVSLFICPIGFYCPAQSYKPTPCPENTYVDVSQQQQMTGLVSESQCMPCIQGYYCAGGSTPPESCPLGSYCPVGAIKPCPPGTYSGFKTGLKNFEECMICPPGYYCPEGSAEPLEYIEGYYNPWTGMSTSASFMKCPASYPCPSKGLSIYKGQACQRGHYCPAGTNNTDDYPCPAGTYSDSHYAITQYDCLPCPAGYACTGGTTSATFDECEEGYYCPQGTTIKNQYPCPAGTYRTNTKAKRIEDCLPCPNGKYCEAHTITPQSCPGGYYCPLGTEYDQQYPCPAGYYNLGTDTDIGTPTQCRLCGFGNYCLGQGQLTPTACDYGTYNNFAKNSDHCLPCPAGYECLTNSHVDPEPCPEGKYSPEGEDVCTDCEVGYYCPVKGISDEAKENNYKCPPGMFCKSGAIGLNVHPNLDDNGCSPGHYCPEGTTTEIPCPAGTYNLIQGRSSLDDCKLAKPGYYTTEGSVTYLDKPCMEGYYCLEGSDSETQYPCVPGTYRGLKQGAQPSDCVICPSGYYCPEATAVPLDCPEGFYCPLGTIKPESCPEGTYSNVKNLFDSKACQPCLPGKFCYQRNLSYPVNDCDKGFYCIQGSKRPEPTDDITGNLCPKGGYCPSGAEEPQECPPGKFMVIEGAYKVEQCVPCTPGYYCLGSNSPEPTGPCDPGYYCDAGSDDRQQHIAPAGTYAPSGSQFPKKCPRGTYGNQQGLDECTECDPGYFCGDVGMTDKDDCPKGYYCHSLTWFNLRGDSYDKLPCPAGTYNDAIGQTSIDACKPCPSGKYCATPGLLSWTGSCAAGFYCKTGSPYEKPPNDESDYGPCPAGHYCEGDDQDPKPCPEGTYSSAIMLTSASQCLTCYEGKYCQGTGQTQPTGDCQAGYYCPEGMTTPTPSSYKCVAPKYCPTGTGSPIECPPGFYNDENEAGKCKECPMGFYCYGGTKYNCPSGFYCP